MYSKKHSIGISLFVNLIFFTCIWVGSAKANISSIYDIRISYGDKLRIVLDVSKNIKPKRINVINNPDRLVIDLPFSNWTVKKTLKQLIKNPVIGLRYGQFSSLIFRVVLELNSTFVLVNSFNLPGSKTNYGYDRLVIDLRRERKLLPFNLPGRKPVINDKKVDKRIVVVLDPGHGGVDPGAVSPAGTMEKDVVLRAAKIIAKVLNKTGKYKVYLTRNSDKRVPLRVRFKIAQKRRAGVFFSIHADSIKGSKARGVALYTLSARGSNKEASRLAKKENASERFFNETLSEQYKSSDRDLKKILDELGPKGFSMALVDERRMSQKLSRSLASELSKVVRMLPNSRRSANFQVLKSPDHPSILIELGFLSNPKDEKLLRSRGYFLKIANALALGLDRFCYRGGEACTPNQDRQANEVEN
tara:strand:+ start:194 stop:1444 length:1251 start_codon:yes stop_codon:yes gene_type:complete